MNQPVEKARAAQLLSPYFFVRSLLAFACLLLVSCGKAPAEVWVISGETMGTYYQVKIVEPVESVSQAEIEAATEKALADVNQMMSTYIPDSELMRFNEAPLDEWIDVSEPLHEVLVISQAVSEASGGAFDITVGPLVNLWGFGPERGSEPPPQERVRETLESIGYSALEVDASALRAKRAEAIVLDLSAVAKGFGADYLAELYLGRGLQNFMIEIGGELYLAGHNPDREPWRIGVEEPSLARSGVTQAIEVQDMGVATSGDYRNFYEADGKRYSHTIDPATGYPVEHDLVSVTVVAPTAAEADAWATALSVLGPDKGLATAEAESLAAYFIERENGELVSKYTGAFAGYLP